MNSILNYSELYKRKQEMNVKEVKKSYNKRKSSWDQSTGHIKDTKKPISTYKQKLKTIFDFYAQMGESVYTTKLKQKKFIKLCSDMGIPDKNFPISSLELLVMKVLTKKTPCIDFENFLNLLNEISKVKSQINKPNESDNNFKNFLDNYPIKLYNHLFTDQISFSSHASFKNYNDNNDESEYDNTNNFKPLIRNKISSSVEVDDLSINNDYEEMLKSISVPMYELYNYYFPLEFAATLPDGYSIKQFIKFTTDFDLFPYMLTKDELFQVFQNEINSSANQNFCDVIVTSLKNSIITSSFNGEFGKYFTFFKFLKGIFKIADFGLEKIPLETFVTNSTPSKSKKNSNSIQKSNRCKYTTFEKICLVLERMELSDTFGKINLKPYSLTYIISQKLLEKIKREIIARDEVLYENLSRNTRENYSLIIDIPENKFHYYDYIIEKYSKELHYIFNLYSEENISLKQSKFIKILLDCGIIKKEKNSKGITTINADLIFIAITKTHNDNQDNVNNNISSVHNRKNAQMSFNANSYQNTPHKINNNNSINALNANEVTLLSAIPYRPKPRQSPFTFSLFIKSIELISKKLHPNKQLKNAVDLVCNTLISQLCQDNFNEENLLDLIYKEKEVNQEFEKVYTIFYQTIYPVFNIYTDMKGMVKLKEFYSFANDFGLFPQCITKTKLLSLFKNAFNYRRDIKNEQEYENGLNHQMFCDVLVQIAFEIPYGEEEPNDIEKLIYLADRLSQSDGMNKIVISLLSSTKLVYGKNFDMMKLFKENYPSYFQNEKHMEDYRKEMEEAKNEEILNEEAEV